jgi:anti-sigma B factor antagonist
MSATLTSELLQNGLLLIGIQGKLDTLGVEQIQEPFGEAISHYTGPILLDMTEVEYMSSAGLSLLVSKGRGQRRRGGDLVVIASTTRVTEVFELTGFEDLFTVYDSLEAALTGVEGTWSDD